MQRGASSLGLFVALAAVLAGARARDLDEDIAETWETTGGDVVVKLVTDLENDPVNAGRKLVRRRACTHRTAAGQRGVRARALICAYCACRSSSCGATTTASCVSSSRTRLAESSSRSDRKDSALCLSTFGRRHPSPF